jgi:F420-dependent oxidoreductase-like protein
MIQSTENVNHASSSSGKILSMGLATINGTDLSNKIQFGVFLSTERPSFSDILSEVKLCEKLGYDSVWFSDHLISMYSQPNANRFECWTTLSALATATSRIRLGELVLCTPFRHPPLLAKMAASLDAISGGRLDLGIGAGWHEPEFKAYGYRFEQPAQRVRRLSEAVQIMKKMWTEPSPSFEGRYFKIQNTFCFPKPVQKPHPPMIIGGSGEQLLLRVVAKYADVCNFSAWLGRPEDYSNKLRVLTRHCMRVGRDPGEIRKSWASCVLVEDDAKKAEEEISLYLRQKPPPPGVSPEGLRPPLSGTPEQCIKQIQSFVDVGIRDRKSVV